jgi:Flp pilus assembly protein TadD
MALLGFLLLCTALGWYFLRTVSIVDSDLNLTVYDFLRNILTIPASLAMFVAPYSFSTVPEFTLTKTIIGCTLLILISVLIVKKTSQPRRKKIFYLLWFLLLLIPTFFAKTKEWDYLDHRFLLPLIGILTLVLLHIQNKSKTKITAVFVIITVVFSIVTIFNSQAFSTPTTFYEAMKHNKSKPDVYYFLKGNIEQVSNRLDNALQSYNAAISHNPEHYRALNNRGIIKQTKGDFEGALADYNKAIDLGLKNHSIFKNRGTVRMTLGDYAGAIRDFETALELEHQTEIYYLRGNAYLALEEEENALEDFNRYFSETSADPEIYTTVGIRFGRKGNIEKSIDCFTKAIETDSTYTIAYYNRAFAEYMSADYAKALFDCNKALAIDSLYLNVQVLKKEVEKSLREKK